MGAAAPCYEMLHRKHDAIQSFLFICLFLLFIVYSVQNFLSEREFISEAVRQKGGYSTGKAAVQTFVLKNFKHREKLEE